MACILAHDESSIKLIVTPKSLEILILVME
jgi:hypothetical protein